MPASSSLARNSGRTVSGLVAPPISWKPYWPYTLARYGTEGYTYNKNADGTISFIDEVRATYSPWTNGMGNVRQLPPTAEQGVDFWERFSAYYDSAEVLPYGSFILDTSELSNEATALANVYGQYGFQLSLFCARRQIFLKGTLFQGRFRAEQGTRFFGRQAF